MHEITKSARVSSSAIPNWAWISIAVLAVFTYFFRLGLPFLGPDEPRYAQVAREMFARGDWVTPTLGGFNWFEKPALLYWLEIGSYTIFGVSEYAARLGPALFGLATVASLFILGLNADRTTDRRGGNHRGDFARWIALIAASTLGILVFSRGASFDIVVTFPITAALVSFFVFDRGRKKALFALPLFYFFIGLAILAKGLIGIVFPLAIVAFYHLLSRRLPTARLLASLFWGTLIVGLVAASWYLPMYQRHGWQFIDEFIIQHHFQRFTSNKYQHPQPFFFYLWVLPLMTLPWMPFFIAAVWNNLKLLFRSLQPRIGAVPASAPSGRFIDLVTFAFAWLLVPLVFFSLSGSKLPGYILPAVPAAIVISSVYIYELACGSTRWARSVVVIACLLFVVSIGLLITVVPKFADQDSMGGLMRSAAERGYADDRLFGLHTISHSAEFYAADRLLRDPQGRQKKHYSPAEVEAEMRRAGITRALILVPPEYLRQLTESQIFRAEVIRNNGESVIVSVTME